MNNSTYKKLVYDKDNKDCLVSYYIDSTGNRHGTYTVHTLDGHLIEKRTYKHGLLEGVVEIYSASTAKCIRRSMYVANRLHGDCKSWSPHGHMLSHQRYVHGVRHGLQETYYLTGTPAERYTMKHGQYHGTYELYDAFQQPIAEYTYDNGVYVTCGKIDTQRTTSVSTQPNTQAYAIK